MQIKLTVVVIFVICKRSHDQGKDITKANETLDFRRSRLEDGDDDNDDDDDEVNVAFLNA